MMDEQEFKYDPFSALACFEFDHKNIQTMHPIRLFSENTKPVFSLDYHKDGEHLVVSSLDDSLTLYNCDNAKKMRTINSKKYGVGKVRFAYDESAVLHSSTKVDNTIRYLSLTENKYVRYFIGHTEEVISISIAPTENLFISTSKDKTIRVWDQRMNTCACMVVADTEGIGAYDDEICFGLMSWKEECLRLFDMRKLTEGPFFEKAVSNPVPGSEWTDLKFNSDGTVALITTNSTYALSLYTHNIDSCIQIYDNIANDDKSPIGGDFTSCGNYVFLGSDGSNVSVYRVEEEMMKCENSPMPTFNTYSLDSFGSFSHPSAITQIAFNPKYCLLAVASQNLEFWIPDFGYIESPNLSPEELPPEDELPPEFDEDLLIKTEPEEDAKTEPEPPVKPEPVDINLEEELASNNVEIKMEPPEMVE